MHSAFLFPGQGSQYVGMGKDFFETFPIAREIYNNASDILGYSLADISFRSSSNELAKTQYTQPAIFIHSVIIDTILKKNNIHPCAVAGHSLGEFSALVSAGSLDYKDALKIVNLRSQEMAKVGKSQSGAMAAIIGANDKQLKIICNQNGIVVPANINTSDQIVISGDSVAIDEAITIANNIGIRRTIKLNVSGAFHSPLMMPVRAPLSKIINNIKFNNANVPIYQNISAKPVTEASEIKLNIINQLENPVLWHKTILNLKKSGLTDFFEVGPGKVLKGFNKRIYPEATTINCDMIENLNAYEIL